MFGLSFDKLIIIGVIAALIIGPEKLPGYAEMLAHWVRRIRDATNGAKARLKEELGEDFDDVDWKKLNPRQYDPRQIIRSALLEDSTSPTAPQRPESDPSVHVKPIVSDVP
ncbi:twin-arginine translocase TatA/TatE family subunit [Agreia sp. PsM10]|uniref:twin-arginine translocase TatA/TatE family subunit n=1 Tax=Agreia sp. PsM10 TaxID=3030533 RepID=UPI00263A4932|nr:twin-arginine translocase TatA/TatE family subunit [Agreia sp. PsM10]MDN4641609.1 twin-arginine translocase TatA/TatE family subunit [Agreia sp. PsM10]